MARERIVGGYVRAARKHQALVDKYNAKFEKTMLPLKRKIDAAHVQVKIRMQKMTGGDLSAAAKILATPNN